MMKTLLLIIICLSISFGAAAKTITDMLGRAVEVPDQIERILPYDSKTSILMFPIASKKMVGKGSLPGKKNYAFISDEYTLIPEVDMKNIEEVLALHPQIIVAGYHDDLNQTETMKKLEDRLHIPVVMVDLSIDHLDKTYDFIGKLLHKEHESKTYSVFLSELYHQVYTYKQAKPNLPASVYYTIGSSGLMTDPAGSKHTEVLTYLNITNAAKIDIPSGGHAKVNIEQVLMWNPDYIFAAGFKGDQNAYRTIQSSSRWGSIRAVQENHLYKIPAQPFGWFDHPPSVNRIPGIIWMCQLFYGQSAASTREKITQFYQLFYQYTLSETEYQKLFQ
jgi:iron complex transport system substrate-binding protein